MNANAKIQEVLFKCHLFNRLKHIRTWRWSKHDGHLQKRRQAVHVNFQPYTIENNMSVKYSLRRITLRKWRNVLSTLLRYNRLRTLFPHNSTSSTTLCRNKHFKVLKPRTCADQQISPYRKGSLTCRRHRRYHTELRLYFHFNSMDAHWRSRHRPEEITDSVQDRNHSYALWY